MSDAVPSPVAGLSDVRRRLAAAMVTAGRTDSACLIAVTKTVSSAAIRETIVAGQRDFGENRVQEAASKWPELRTETPDIVLHLIGPLQTNKVREAVALFDVIHTVDRPRLAEALATEMASQSRPRDCFVQVNTGREAQKAGVDPADADDFIAACRQTWKLPVVGLMCIPPLTEEPSLHFAFLREIARRNKLGRLSMGMSGDFEAAVLFGATHIRVGSAIFGARV